MCSYIHLSSFILNLKPALTDPSIFFLTFPAHTHLLFWSSAVHTSYAIFFASIIPYFYALFILSTFHMWNVSSSVRPKNHEYSFRYPPVPRIYITEIAPCISISDCTAMIYRACFICRMNTWCKWQIQFYKYDIFP